MKKYRLALSLLLAVLCAFSLAAAAEAPNQALIFGMDLSETELPWINDLKLCAPYWEPFPVVEVPDQSWFRVYQLPGNVYALYEWRQSELVVSYLIIGETSALLWDTGLGIGDIRACV